MKLRYEKNETKRQYYRELKAIFDRTIEGAAEDWNWPLLNFATEQTLIKIFSRFELFCDVREVPGSIVEMGSFFGTTSLLFKNFCNMYEGDLERRIIAFDKFSTNEAAGADLKFNYFTHAEFLKNLKQTAELHSAINAKRFRDCKLELIDGDIRTTLPSFLESDPDLTVSLLYLDVDCEKLTKYILECLVSRMAHRGVIAIEGFQNINTPGIARVFRDFQEVHGVKWAAKRVGREKFLTKFVMGSE